MYVSGEIKSKGGLDTPVELSYFCLCREMSLSGKVACCQLTAIGREMPLLKGPGTNPCSYKAMHDTFVVHKDQIVPG